MQAKNTIIQVAHSSSSIKNKSRNSNYKRVSFNGIYDSSSSNSISDDNELMKSNRSTTKKCNCKFSITILYDEDTKFWYLRDQKRNKNQLKYHSNHMWIDPKYITQLKNDISPSIIQKVQALIDSGHGIPSIQSFIKISHNVNIDYQTIYNMRLKSIDNLIKQCKETPYGSSVDKLISLFKVTKSVSFVYIIHRSNSGFVTYRKSKTNPLSHFPSTFNETSLSQQLSTNSINNWRHSLSLSDSNNVLVAFAWAHDEELKAAEKHPHFLACDVTFGVNKQRRELFLAAGCDGRNKAFTAFRCFIPSKQEQAYTWIINEALSHILTPEILKYNQCISCDQEISLNLSINNAIESNKHSFIHSSLRLDCYHFFNKVFMEKVVLKAKDNEEAKQSLKVIKDWIMTWFKYIESKFEYEYSLNKFKSFFETTHQCLGDAAVDELTKLVNNINTKRKFLLHYYFMDIATFDFLGDSIVESVNFSLKKGNLKVSSKMDISNSGFTQLKSTEAKYMKEYIASAKAINRTNTWTQSKTSKYLTDYCEGLACLNYDRSNEYTFRKVSHNTFYVTHKSNLDELNTSQNKTNIPRFARILVITKTPSNHLTCSCGYCQRWFIPCVHICSLINSIDLYTIDLFHIKWWKHFNFLYKLGESSNDIKTRMSLKSALSHTRDNDFNIDDGKYKGIPLKGTLLLNHLDSITITPHDSNDNILSYMNNVLDLNKNGLCICKHSNTYSKLIQDHFNNKKCSSTSTVGPTSLIENDEDQNNGFDTIGELDDENNNITNEHTTDLGTMGAGSQVESHLSTFRSEYARGTKRKDDVMDNFYNEIEPYFKELVQSITNKEQLFASINAIEKQTFNNLSTSTNKKDSESIGTTFLGEHINAPARKESRHKFIHERFTSKK